MTQKPTNSTKYGDYSYGPQNFCSRSYGDGDVPEVDYEPYRNGSRIVTPVDPLPESFRERRDGPGGDAGK